MNGKIIEAKCLREKAEFTIKPNKSGVESGIYKWWASKSEIKAIFDALEINLNDVINGVEKLGKGIGSKRTELNKELLLNYSAIPIDTTKLKGVQTANNVDLKY